jgi:hypothetical protein
MFAPLRRFVWWRLAVALVAALWVLRFLIDPGIILTSWMHGVLLVIHEAGHFLTPFGEFATLLGGSFWQVMIPLALATYFALTRRPFSAGLLLLLVAFSLADVALYVEDARERELPLITGDVNSHDWWNLLLILDLFRRDDLLASLFRLQAFAALFAGLAVTLIHARRRGVRA